jgi:predicted nucleic acid-binding protein
MSDFRKLYWDTTCFICFLNDSEIEKERRYVCEDILKHCANGVVEIWTSSLTIAEVIRPKEKFVAKQLPSWTESVLEKFPTVEPHIRNLWDFHTKRTRRTRTLTPGEVDGIRQLLHPDRIRTIKLDDRIAASAVDIARTYGLKPADAVHAASALDLYKRKKVEALQHWDNDFEKIQHLLPVEPPTRISSQHEFKEFMKPLDKSG